MTVTEAVAAGDIDLLRTVIARARSAQDLDAKDAQGRSAFHVCVVRALESNGVKMMFNRFLLMVRILAEAGADINAIDVQCDTPLHLAARSGKRLLAKIIAECGGDPTLRNLKGYTAFDSRRTEEVGDFMMTGAQDFKARGLQVHRPVSPSRNPAAPAGQPLPLPLPLPPPPRQLPRSPGRDRGRARSRSRSRERRRERSRDAAAGRDSRGGGHDKERDSRSRPRSSPGRSDRDRERDRGKAGAASAAAAPAVDVVAAAVRGLRLLGYLGAQVHPNAQRVRSGTAVSGPGLLAVAFPGEAHRADVEALVDFAREEAKAAAAAAAGAADAAAVAAAPQAGAAGTQKRIVIAQGFTDGAKEAAALQGVCLFTAYGGPGGAELLFRNTHAMRLVDRQQRSGAVAAAAAALAAPAPAAGGAAPMDSEPSADKDKDPSATPVSLTAAAAAETSGGPAAPSTAPPAGEYLYVGAQRLHSGTTPPTSTAGGAGAAASGATSGGDAHAEAGAESSALVAELLSGAPPAKWTPRQVAVWADQVAGLGAYMSAFAPLTGEDLLELNPADDDDMEAMGMKGNKVHRRALAKHLERLRRGEWGGGGEQEEGGGGGGEQGAGEREQAQQGAGEGQQQVPVPSGGAEHTGGDA